jgi:hypothetical protein
VTILVHSSLHLATHRGVVYKKMFSDPSNWFGYADFDENEIKQKIFVKLA